VDISPVLPPGVSLSSELLTISDLRHCLHLVSLPHTPCLNTLQQQQRHQILNLKLERLIFSDNAICALFCTGNAVICMLIFLRHVGGKMINLEATNSLLVPCPVQCCLPVCNYHHSFCFWLSTSCLSPTHTRRPLLQKNLKFYHEIV